MLGENTGAENTAAPGSKIDRETAEAEFIRFCESNRIENDETAMNDEEIESFRDIKKRFIGACTQGLVEVDGTSINYTVSDFSPEGFKGKTVTIKRPGGYAFTAMDNFKEKESVHKLLGFMSAMTGQEIKFFSKIDIFDWKFFNAIASLFLAL